MKTRSLRLAAAVKQSPWEVVVIGGGASGLGCALAAAARGYKTILLEQSDLDKGTSSRSTKLIHGGVRYLRQGNIRLVREALQERGILMRNAPHLVSSLPHLVPVYSSWEKLFYAVGLKVYELLAGSHSLGKPRILSRAQTLQDLTTLSRDGLCGGVLYYDAQFDDARMAVSVARTVDGLGGLVLNYCRVTSFVKRADRIAGVILEDRESGRRFQIEGKVVINATGVFSDQVSLLDDPSHHPRIAASRGTHLVLDRRWLPSREGLLIPRTRDGRVLFALPWNGVLVVGTTDDPTLDIRLEPTPTLADATYILDHLSRYLDPAPGLADCLSVFSGLRPLIGGEQRPTSKLSREHLVFVSPSGLVSLTGGKWTTFRRMGEDAVDQAIQVGGLAPSDPATAELPLWGAWEDDSEQDHLSVYGRDRMEMVRLAGVRPELGERIHPRLPYSDYQVVWAIHKELARTVEDVLARRTRALLLDAAASMEAAPDVARLMASELGKDHLWQAEQVENYCRVASGYLASNLTETETVSGEQGPPQARR